MSYRQALPARRTSRILFRAEIPSSGSRRTGSTPVALRRAYSSVALRASVARSQPVATALQFAREAALSRRAAKSREEASRAWYRLANRSFQTRLRAHEKCRIYRRAAGYTC